jgi:hypothetical protein
MKISKALLMAMASVALLAIAAPALAGPYYQGKTITLIVHNMIALSARSACRLLQQNRPKATIAQPITLRSGAQLSI